MRSLGRRHRGTVIAGRPLQPRRFHAVPAGRWLRTAPGPPARTAALDRQVGVADGVDTAMEAMEESTTDARSDR